MSASDTDPRPTVDERRHAEQRTLAEGAAAALEHDIDATRADVRATLAALEQRLSFDRVMELTVGRIRERGGEFAGNLSDAVAQNPVPLLLTSVGLGWMMLTSRRGNGAGETTESVRTGASRTAAATREQLDTARERMERLMEEQPLLLGALGLAAGAVIGALLPTTEAEDRVAGDLREKAVKSAARTSRARYEAAREEAASYAATHSRDEEIGGERPSRPH